MKNFSKLILLITLLFGGIFSHSVAVAADSCPFRLEVKYADGQKGCLTDLPIAKKKSKSWGKSISDVAMFASNYVIVSSSVCDVSEIFTASGLPIAVRQMYDRVESFIARDCPDKCDCAKVVNDGSVLVSKDLALALGSTSLASPDSATVSEKPNSKVQGSHNDTNKNIQSLVSPVSQQISPLQPPVQVTVAPNRQQEADLLAQISAELARLRAENETVKEERKALTQTLANVNIQKQVAVMANRRALVIGNDSYKFVAPLLNAREDAKTMAAELSSVGYNVTLKLDLTEKELKSTLRIFRNQIEAGDEVAFFYAGHGVQLDNSNFLLPVDVAGEAEDQIRDEAIALQRILDDVASKKAKFTLAMIDACRDNPFKVSGRTIGGGSRGLAPTTAATGQMVIFSAGSGQQALDKLGPSDKSKNGLFTRVFAKEIKTPGVTIDRLVKNVRNQVAELAKSVGHEQVPAIYDQVLGDFYFKK